MNEQERTLLEQLVARLASRAPRRWQRVVLNWELEQDADGDFVDDIYLFCVVKSFSSGLSKNQDVEADPEDGDLVHALRTSMAERGSAWSTLDLEIDNDGDYRVDFDYDSPRRLHGIDDEQSVGRFENYLTTYSG